MPADRDGGPSEPSAAADEVAHDGVPAFTVVETGEPAQPEDGSEPSADGHAEETIERTQVTSAPGVGATEPSLTAPGPVNGITAPGPVNGITAPGPVNGMTAQAPVSGSPEQAPVERQGGGCTTAQLRRFIKSRAYVPMHEIRRRFLIATEDDDVAWIDLETGRVFVGLPPREGQMLGELLRGGEVGYELQLDPVAPVVVGVYPMRPVSRS